MTTYDCPACRGLEAWCPCCYGNSNGATLSQIQTWLVRAKEQEVEAEQRVHTDWLAQREEAKRLLGESLPTHHLCPSCTRLNGRPRKKCPICYGERVTVAQVNARKGRVGHFEQAHLFVWVTQQQAKQAQVERLREARRPTSPIPDQFNFSRDKDGKLTPTNGVETIPCPHCREGVLIQRVNKVEQTKFFGCSRFPQCRYSCDTIEDGHTVRHPRRRFFRNSDEDRYDPGWDHPGDPSDFGDRD